jgi:tRNA (mo5U34)-methyltransferase
MHIDELARGVPEFIRFLEATKANIAPTEFKWYPYGSLYNVYHLDKLLGADHRDLGRLIGSRRIADIGAADGELAFFLERHGAEVDVVDWPSTNFNGLRGVRALKASLGSSVRVHEVDLDSQFRLPEESYGLAVFLGILYHLKNPYFVLEELAKRADYCLLSTRIARQTPDGSVTLAQYPLAYLVGETELNNDSTNYWIFSEEGLRRILGRTGWEVCDFVTVGDTAASDPARSDRDERAFCLLRSRRRTGPASGDAAR